MVCINIVYLFAHFCFRWTCYVYGGQDCTEWQSQHGTREGSLADNATGYLNFKRAIYASELPMFLCFY